MISLQGVMRCTKPNVLSGGSTVVVSFEMSAYGLWNCVGQSSTPGTFQRVCHRCRCQQICCTASINS